MCGTKYVLVPSPIAYKRSPPPPPLHSKLAKGHYLPPCKVYLHFSTTCMRFEDVDFICLTLEPIL
jgi:hypothetical protein